MYPMLLLLLLLVNEEVTGRRWKEGPSVDPGVFVITHIRSCRNGAGYCILGIDCTVDTDFVDDDSGGDCNSLGTAFSPQAKFVCCKENPENFVNSPEDNLEAVILEQNTVPPTTTSTATSVVTDIVTEIYTHTELYTKVEEHTEVFTQIVTEIIQNQNQSTTVSPGEATVQAPAETSPSTEVSKPAGEGLLDSDPGSVPAGEGPVISAEDLLFGEDHSTGETGAGTNPTPTVQG